MGQVARRAAAAVKGDSVGARMAGQRIKAGHFATSGESCRETRRVVGGSKAMTAPETPPGAASGPALTPTTESSAIQSAPVVSVDHIAEWEGKTVTIRGWLYNLRESGKLLFPIFRDGTRSEERRVGKECR